MLEIGDYPQDSTVYEVQHKPASDNLPGGWIGYAKGGELPIKAALDELREASNKDGQTLQWRVIKITTTVEAMDW